MDRLALPRGRSLSFSGVPLVMGIINVTPDSFSDGGAHYDPRIAIESSLAMEAEGAAVIDVGGESTRPGAQAVGADEERARVLPVIEGIRRRSDIPISIDTMKSAVAVAAIAAGADLVNDVTALRFDPGLADVIRDRNVPVILMHMRGEPRTMQESIHYDDLMGEIEGELAAWASAAVKAGIARESILIDPGIGFGKTFDHNLEILARCGELSAIAPFVIGASRKAFIGHLTGRSAGRERMPGSLAAIAAAADGGAAVVRAHDVAETVDFLRVHEAIGGARR
ncbi:MAG TPA: dihydropteroate synthase [Thermoanaerobaculia bacterium]|nr:dihydropteroate synthase [Thermoanaerobaculia bacterium]